MEHLHYRGDAHFAINPWNILVIQRQSVIKYVIGDFGLELHSEARRETKVAVGGPHTRYLAPEVIEKVKGRHQVRHYDKEALMADIFSLGMVFKEVKKHIGKRFFDGF